MILFLKWNGRWIPWKNILWTIFGYHGGTSNIGQGMPPPLTPSMPPLMAP